MEEAEQLRIHCTTLRAHEDLMQVHANDLLRLTQTHSVKLFSPTETLETASRSLDEGSDSKPNSRSQQKQLDIAVLQRNLATEWCGHMLVSLPQTATTQNVLLRLMPWCNSGSVAVTGFQTKGRGRRGAIWQSPIGSVAISVKVTVPSASFTTLTFLQYIAALAVVQAAKRKWNIPLRIKWPNDIYKDGDKLGGVLCEGALRDNQFEVVVGVGVNVTNQFPTTCLLDPTTTNGREIFVAYFLVEFERLYNTYREHGFDGELRSMYLDAWIHSGQQLRIGGPDGVRAVVHGLAPNGWVRVLREDSNSAEDLPPEYTSLDMKNSILKQKEVGPR
ncbi:anaphase-promoting complex subunit 2 [Gracilaria domingensis]|nr:anaphase-promoting complex subunit 2 [Gracilaria domingensis]